ncbi:MAG: flagellar hook-associated protein FlgK, partial [Defluviitaleaceae bacterium]|nr:flagellar hook-associated protein FlgK [Defluviitaleaceae bacterium]
VVSHNIANSAMPGFSRQQTLQKASRPLNLFNGRGLYGTGSEVYGIIQIRDIYLDWKYWTQRGILGEYSTKNNHLAVMENLFNDFNDAGIRTGFMDFFNRCQDLSTNTPDATYRANVITSAETLAQLIRNNAEALQKQQRDINFEITGIVTRINSLGTQIASLNRQIYQYELDGQNANDLRDQRALLVDTLSEYVNVQVDERDFGNSHIQFDKRFTVMINGYDFVNHFQVQQLVCVPRDIIDEFGDPSLITLDGREYMSSEKRNDMDVPGLYDIYFKGSGALFDIYSKTLQGTLKGLIDIRDGNNNDEATMVDAKKPTTAYKGIPFYMQKLNILVRTFTRAINEGRNVDGESIKDVIGHLDGYNKYGMESGKPSGILLFTRVVGNEVYTADDFGYILLPNGNRVLDYSKLNCLNFSINPDLLSDPFLLATSSEAYIGESNNYVTHGFGKLNSYPSLFKEGKLIDFIIGTTDHLAIDRMQAIKFDLSYNDISMATQNQRLSVSGVDLNEEMVALVKYQQLFVACARLVNVIDDVYNTLVNRLGNF